MDIIKTRAFYEQIAEPHFVIEAYPIRLKWVMQSSAKKGVNKKATSQE